MFNSLLSKFAQILTLKGAETKPTDADQLQTERLTQVLDEHLNHIAGGHGSSDYSVHPSISNDNEK